MTSECSRSIPRCNAGVGQSEETGQLGETGQTSSLYQAKTPNCHVCCDLDPEKSVKRFSMFTTTSLTKLDVAASAGGPSCALLREGIKQTNFWTRTAKFAMYITEFLQLVVRLLEQRLGIESSRRSYDYHHLEFYSCKGTDTGSCYASRGHTGVKVVRPKGSGTSRLISAKDLDAPTIWPAIGLGREVSSDPSSEECMELAVQWLTDCTEHHGQCQRPGSTPLPTRVILIGSEDDRLSPYTTRGECDRYVALSHCWGRNKPPLQTMKATFGRRAIGILFEEFPKTFQDAIVITRRLGLKYLWIDSLCIIQDCPQDWATEAAKMATVYRNAYVTIAADAASNSHEGCFYTRGRRRDLQLPYAVPNGQEGTVRVRSYSRDRSGPDGLAHNCSNNTLATRAWTLQERILAPRILHYTTAELVWECATQVSCECQVQPDGADQFLLRRWLIDGPPRLDSDKDVIDTHTFLGGWENIVEDFTRREISFATDRLPALSGMAAAIEEITSATYVCGLWYQEIEFGLLWHTPRSEPKTRQRQGRNYAPSFSWASITGPVCYTAAAREHMSISSYFQVLDVKGRLAGANPYGPVKDSSIKLQGVLCEVRLERDEASDSEELRLASIEQPELRSKIFYPDVNSDDDSEISVGERYFFLIVVCDDVDPENPMTVGLVLKRSPSCPGKYTRIGFMATWELAENWYAVGHRGGIVIV